MGEPGGTTSAEEPLFSAIPQRLAVGATICGVTVMVRRMGRESSHLSVRHIACQLSIGPLGGCL